MEADKLMQGKEPIIWTIEYLFNLKMAKYWSISSLCALPCQTAQSE